MLAGHLARLVTAMFTGVTSSETASERIFSGPVANASSASGDKLSDTTNPRRIAIRHRWQMTRYRSAITPQQWAQFRPSGSAVGANPSSKGNEMQRSFYTIGYER